MTLDEVRALAMWMIVEVRRASTSRTAAAKGGVIVDPKKLSHA